MKQQPSRSLSDSFEWITDALFIFAASSFAVAIAAKLMSYQFTALYLSALSVLTVAFVMAAALAAMLCMWLASTAIPAWRSFVGSLTTPPQQ